MRRVRQKEANLRELLLQHVAFKRLIDRNRKTEEKEGSPKYAFLALEELITRVRTVLKIGKIGFFLVNRFR